MNLYPLYYLLTNGIWRRRETWPRVILLTFGCLQNLATRNGISKSDSVSRPDLVGAVRKEGIGSHPILEGMTGIGDITTALASLSTTIMDLNKEMMATKGGRDDEIASLKLEIQ